LFQDDLQLKKDGKLTFRLNNRSVFLQLNTGNPLNVIDQWLLDLVSIFCCRVLS
jgi:hypothetical protein